MRDQWFVSTDAVALSAGVAKTVVEGATSATSRMRPYRVAIGFDGVTAANTPVKCEIGVASAAVTTATTQTASKVEPGAPASQTVWKVATSTEGAGTMTTPEVVRIPPTSTMEKPYELSTELVVPVSGFFRVRLTAAQAVNATVTIWSSE